MADRLADRALEYKARRFGAESQAARRAAIFTKQRDARDAIYRELRLAALATDSHSAEPRSPTPLDDAGIVPDDELSVVSATESTCRSRKPKSREQKSRLARAPVALPEWLVEIPDDLAESWYVIPRPDGKRVFVVASAGRTVLRTRDGRILPSQGICRSELPGGKPGSKGMTMLDCILTSQSFRRKRRQLWVLDVYAWNDTYMHDCTAEFRFFWLRTSLEQLMIETGHGVVDELDDDSEEIFGDDTSAASNLTNATGCDQDQSGSFVTFRPVPFYDADESGLSAATDTSLNVSNNIEKQDGLLFYVKDAHVEVGLTPVVLAWKDDCTSEHLIETFPEPGPSDVDKADWPLVTTLARMPSDLDNGISLLSTADDPPVIVGEVSTTKLLSFNRNALSRLVRARVVNTRAIASGAHAEVEVIGVAGAMRRTADSWSRIVFQCQARHKPIKLEQLMPCHKMRI